MILRESALTLILPAERISAFPCEHGALDSQCPMRYTPLRVGGVDSDYSEAFRAEMFTGILSRYRLVAAAIVSHKRPHILGPEFCGALPVPLPQETRGTAEDYPGRITEMLCYWLNYGYLKYNLTSLSLWSKESLFGEKGEVLHG